MLCFNVTLSSCGQLELIYAKLVSAGNICAQTYRKGKAPIITGQFVCVELLTVTLTVHSYNHKPLTHQSQICPTTVLNQSHNSHTPVTQQSQSSHNSVTIQSHTSHTIVPNQSQTSQKPLRNDLKTVKRQNCGFNLCSSLQSRDIWENDVTLSKKAT